MGCVVMVLFFTCLCYALGRWVDLLESDSPLLLFIVDVMRFCGWPSAWFS